MRNLVDDVQFFDGDLIDFIQHVDGRYVDPVAFDQIDDVVLRGVTSNDEILGKKWNACEGEQCRCVDVRHCVSCIRREWL